MRGFHSVECLSFVRWENILYVWSKRVPYGHGFWCNDGKKKKKQVSHIHFGLARISPWNNTRVHYYFPVNDLHCGSWKVWRWINKETRGRGCRESIPEWSRRVLYVHVWEGVSTNKGKTKHTRVSRYSTKKTPEQVSPAPKGFNKSPEYAGCCCVAVWCLEDILNWRKSGERDIAGSPVASGSDAERDSVSELALKSRASLSMSSTKSGRVKVVTCKLCGSEDFLSSSKASSGPFVMAMILTR